MKSLRMFIDESLNSKVQKWIKQVYNAMIQLNKDNKIQPIEVDVNNLAKPQQSFEYKEYSDDMIFKKIISNKVFGFVVSNQILQTPKKYLIYQSNAENGENKLLEPKCLPYWYRKSSQTNEANEEVELSNNPIDPTYFVGLVLYDTNTSLIEGYINLVSIETSLCVKESLPVLKAMLNDWALHYMNKEGKYIGIASKPLHPKMKSILMKLGFSPTKDNKEILAYKI